MGFEVPVLEPCLAETPKQELRVGQTARQEQMQGAVRLVPSSFARRPFLYKQLTFFRQYPAITTADHVTLTLSVSAYSVAIVSSFRPTLEIACEISVRMRHFVSCLGS